MTTPDQELLDTIEEIRKQKFPELPGDLVRQIVLIERDYTENRQEAFKRVARAIDEYLAGAGAKTEEE
jgi:hypothetical protein